MVAGFFCFLDKTRKNIFLKRRDISIDAEYNITKLLQNTFKFVFKFL